MVASCMLLRSYDIIVVFLILIKINKDLMNQNISLSFLSCYILKSFKIFIKKKPKKTTLWL